MSRSGQPPDLKKYMDKKLQIKLNANCVVIGTLQGFDQFMNLVVDNTVEGFSLGFHSTVLRRNLPHGRCHRPSPRDSLRDVRKRHDNNRESTSQQGSNDIRAPQERQTEWARHGRVLNRNINRGGYSRNSLPGVTREFRIVKDNRTKQKADGETVSESFHNGDSSNGQALSNFGDKSSTEKLAAQRYLVTRNSNGHGTIQADNGRKIAAQAHDKEVKPSSDQGLEQSEGTRTKLVSPHAVLVKGNQNKLLTVPSGTKNFTGELCCSSSDPIHVPFPGSKSAGTFGAIKREVGVVGARQRPSDSAATNTSTSNSLVTAITATKDNASNEQQSRLPGASSKNSYASSSVSLSSRPVPSSQYHSKPSINVGHSKVNSHLEWKPKSVNPRSVNHAVTMAPSRATSSVDGNQVGLVDLSKKLSRANVFEDEHVIIPEHLRVPDSERTHLIFGSFEPEVESKALTSVSDTATKEGLNGHSSTSLTALNSVRSTDNVPPSDQTDLDGFCAAVSQSDSVVSVSEHQQLMTEDMEVPNPGAIGECRSNEMISKVTHSFPQSQHQGNSAVQNFKAYEPDSRYEMPFITKAADGETAQTIAYSSEIMGLHPGNVNQLSVSATQQPVPQMYPQVQVPQYPNFLSYRHVFSPYYVPPVAVPNYSSNPAFPQLPHASSYLVMPNGNSQLAANGVKYGPPHQYKQVFPGAGSPAGYGGYANHVSTGVIGSTGTVEDASMSKYKDNNLYTPNPQVETTDVWIQAHRDIPNMPSAPFYNLMGQPVSPHTAYLPEHNAHAPFSPAPHAAHLQYPGMPHTLQPTSMTMVQNPQSMVHQPAAPPLAGNGGIDMTAMAPGAQVGAFQQNQLGHLGWAPNF